NNVPVTFATLVQPASLLVNAAKDYVFGGSGGVAGTNTLAKSGTGTLTLANSNSFTGGMTISNGIVRLASANLGLTHRWSFNNSLADSVGAQAAVIVDVGANNVTLTASNVTLAGGTSTTSDYVSLGSDLLPNNTTPATIEIWATQNSIQNWSRIFDFGSGTSENLIMSWTKATTLTQDRVEWLDSPNTNTVDNSNQPYTASVEFHIVMVIQPGAGAGGTTRVTWYRAPSSTNAIGAARGIFDSAINLSTFNDVNCWLGRSEYSSDSVANASYNEVRIWNRALSTNELQSLHVAGPNAVLETLNIGQAPATVSGGGALNLAGSSAVLENASSQTLNVGSLTGVAGSEVRMPSAGLSAGANGASSSFAGFLSGSGGFTKQGAGTLTLSGNSTHTGPTTVSAGTLLLQGNNSAATGIVAVQNGATLGGNGTIGGATTIQLGGILSPGTSIGNLGFLSTLGLNGVTLMEVTRAPLTNDTLTLSGPLNYAATLTVTNLGGSLVAGDKFKLFNASAYSGSFDTINLPTLSAGLVWNTSKLNVSGTLWVVSTNAPQLSTPSVSGGNFNFGGTGGTPGWDYYVITSTNLTLPLDQWTRVMTNQFDAAGNCSVALPFDAAQPRLFYRVLVP
ncbi:MAG: hypothetical protein RLY20_552, partial [Verrucomicrobiota bacterium]